MGTTERSQRTPAHAQGVSDGSTSLMLQCLVHSASLADVSQTQGATPSSEEDLTARALRYSGDLP